MKNIKIALSLFLIFFLLEFSFAQDWANLKRFQKENAELTIPKLGEHRIVFMGNSIIEGWLRIRPEFFIGRSYVNRAISGQTTPQMLLRFRQDVINLSPSAVVILAGINDIAENTGPSTIEMIADNIFSMSELAKANNINVVLCSVLPAFDFSWRKGLEPAEKVIKLNALIEAYANNNKIAYVDFFTAMVNESKGLKEELGSDSVHPNSIGYSIMEPLIENAIDVIIKSGSEKIAFDHNGLTREYILYKPHNLPANAPLVIALHGYGSSSEKIMAYSGMNSISDINGFAVCYPQGLLDEKGKSNWNARLTFTTTDDIGFLTELAKYLQKKHNLSAKNTFVCGMSNGGFMSYTLACEKPDIFKAIGSVCGTMSGQTWNNRNISVPIPILQIHGTADKTVPIDGSMNIPGGWGGAPAIDSVIAYWTKENSCTTKDSTFFPQNTKAYYYRNGTRGNEVWYYKIENWGHVWPGAPSKDPNKINNTGTKASEVIWEFFSKFLK